MTRGLPHKVGVTLNLGVVQVRGDWEPNHAERAAAWEVYVELVTRVATVPLEPEEGLLREALSSLYSVFESTREVLRRHGPDLAEPKPDGQVNFAFLAVTILSRGIRPLLTRWHPLLADWEARRPPDVTPVAHERAWDRAPELRAELEVTRQALTRYAAALADACGVPNLLEGGS